MARSVVCFRSDVFLYEEYPPLYSCDLVNGLLQQCMRSCVAKLPAYDKSLCPGKTAGLRFLSESLLLLRIISNIDLIHSQGTETCTLLY